MFVEQQAGEGEGHGPEADPGRGTADEGEYDAEPEEGLVAPARHLADGEARVRGRVRERRLAPD